MFFEYLKNAIERIKAAPQSKIYSPQFCRSWELPDGQLVVADTYDLTEMDKKEVTSSPSFLDFFRAHQKPPVVGSLNPNNALTAAQFSQVFLAKFNSLNNIKDEHPAENGNPVGATANEPVGQPAEPVA